MNPHNKEKNKNKQKFTFDQRKQLLFEYCNVNQECPKLNIEYKNQCVGNWLGTQKYKISSKEDDLYIKLAQNKHVKKALDAYLLNKVKNKNKKMFTFVESKQLLFEYCEINKKCAMYKTVHKNCSIGNWLKNQKTQIKSTQDNLYIKLAENAYVKHSLDTYLSTRKKKRKKCDQDWSNEVTQPIICIQTESDIKLGKSEVVHNNLNINDIDEINKLFSDITTKNEHDDEDSDTNKKRKRKIKKCDQDGLNEVTQQKCMQTALESNNKSSMSNRNEYNNNNNKVDLEVLFSAFDATITLANQSMRNEDFETALSHLKDGLYDLNKYINCDINIAAIP
eukprot:47985_1